MRANAAYCTVVEADCRAVVTAAGILDLKEFEFFRLAYRRWFGEQPLPEVLERVFSRYMMNQVVPPWVRKLARDVIAAEARGPVDARAFGADRFRDRPRPHPRGRLFVAGFMAVWGLLFAMLLETGNTPRAAAEPATLCHRTGAPAMEAWAHLLAGKRPQCSTTAAADRQATSPQAATPDGK